MPADATSFAVAKWQAGMTGFAVSFPLSLGLVSGNFTPGNVLIEPPSWTDHSLT